MPLPRGSELVTRECRKLHRKPAEAGARCAGMASRGPGTDGRTRPKDKRPDRKSDAILFFERWCVIVAAAGVLVLIATVTGQRLSESR
jgi:hypothetical protein